VPVRAGRWHSRKSGDLAEHVEEAIGISANMNTEAAEGKEIGLSSKKRLPGRVKVSWICIRAKQTGVGSSARIGNNRREQNERDLGSGPIDGRPGSAHSSCSDRPPFAHLSRIPEQSQIQKRRRLLKNDLCRFRCPEAEPIRPRFQTRPRDSKRAHLTVCSIAKESQGSEGGRA
jgi:hypothetical protein